MTDILWDSRLTFLGVTIEPAPDSLAPYWELIAAWIIVNGSWDDVPAFARKWQLDSLGGDHHAFGRALDRDGNMLPVAGFVLGWPDGAAQRVPEADGWANIPMAAGFDWTQTSGPYSWAKFGNADKLLGLGLPFPPLPWETQDLGDYPDVYIMGGVHVSFFGVWQLTNPGPEPGPPPTDDCWQHLAAFWRCVWRKIR